MPIPDPHLDLATIDFSRTIADIHAIRELIPQRPPFEMLTAVVHLDNPNHLIVAYKDIANDEFWVPGHMPGYPLLPGVLMLEAAAQMSTYYVRATKVVGPELVIGLGGIDGARFRRAVRPGNRLVLVGKGLKVKPRLTLFNVQGYVNGELAFDAEVMGVSLGKSTELGS